MKVVAILAFWQALGVAGPLAFHFEQNVGQARSQVRYLAKVRSATISIEDEGIVLYRRSDAGVTKIQIRLEGTSPGASWQTMEPVPGTTSYLIGNDPRAWIRDVPHFRQLVRKSVYPGVDLTLYGVEGRLEYDFVLAPGADAAQIRTRISGTNELSLASNGDLVLRLSNGSIVQKKPSLYQAASDGSLTPVHGGYVLLGDGLVGFEVHGYDASRPLTIDPVLESATLLGGSGDDRIFYVDPTSEVIGSTTSADFQGVEAGRHSGVDIFIYNPQTQSTVILGGSGDDIVTSVSVASGIRGAVLVGGYTNSRDFPVTGGAPFFSQFATPQRQYGGGDWDGFLLYFYFVGSNQPVISTYLGGSGDDRVLAVHSDGNVFTAAGSTTSTDFPLRSAWQTVPGGGVDGFATVIDGFSGSLLTSSYVGGSGDDRVLATHVTAGPSGMDLYLAGETRSTDWQPASPWSGTRKGSSDGYILHVKSADQLATFSLAGGAFLGGGAEDRVTALSQLDTGAVVAAGVTSSPDFPVTNAAQTYGGGASDAFLAELSPDLQTISYSTLLGGSGAEEPLAVATNQFHELMIGGWTDSSDFPVVAPLPSNCGRGPEDGFLVYLDAALQTLLSTCYGGSGSDRITSVSFGDVERIFLGGITDSPDLPLQNAVQPANAGALDGFFAEITVPVIHAEGLQAGKDLAALGYAQLGDSSNYVGVPLTVTSMDPSRVLLAIRPDDAGQASITVSNGNASDLAGRSFRAYCLVDSSKTGIQLSAPGYPQKIVNVACLPSGLYVGKPDLRIQSSQGAISVVTAAIDPVSQALVQVQNPRGGLDAIRVDASTANTNLQIGTSTVTIDSLSSFPTTGSYDPNAISFQFTDAGGGDITLATTAPFPFVPSNTIHIRRAAAISISIPPLARDLVGNVYVTFTPPLPGGVNFTLTSSDPSKARITTGASQNGQASVTFSSGAPTLIEALDDTGSVSITAIAPGYDPVTTPLRFFPLTGGFVDKSCQPLQNATLSITDSLLAFVYLYPDFRVPSCNWPLRAGAAPIEMRVENPNNTIASPGGVVGNFGPGGVGGQAFQINALSPGTATFTLHLSGAAALPVKSGSLRVDVSASQISLSPVTVGYNLMAQMQLSLGGPFPKNLPAITITSSDPSRVLLSTDLQTPGQASVTLPSAFGPIFVYSLVNAGFVDVTASADGYQSAHATITSVPSGFAWVNSAITLGQGNPVGSGGSAALGVYALDPTTLAPIARQATRPGLSGTIALQNSNPSVVALSQDNVPLSALATLAFNPAAISLTPAGGGDAQIAITQPPGFAQPLGHGPLHVKVSSPSIQLSIPTLGRSLQAGLALSFVNLPPGAQTGNPAVTITSSDPSKLLVSASDSTPGSASVTILSRPSDGYPTVYLQALDGPADVKITATAQGFSDSSAIVQILASSIAFSNSYSFPTPGIQMNTQQDPIAFNIGPVALQDSVLYKAGGETPGILRAGLGPISIPIRSSNPNVAAAVNNPILNSLTGQATFQLKALSPGTTQLTVVQPAGFVAPPPGSPRTLPVVVQGPSFAISNVVIGQDLQTPITLSVKSGAAVVPSDVDVSISSSDASKLLISADPGTIGTGALTVHFIKGASSSSQIYLQALDQSGTVSVQISAAGYGSSSANVKLAPATFIDYLDNLFGAIPNSSLTLRFRPVPSSIPNPFTNIYSFRPGLTSFMIAASTSDPSVLSISNPTLTVSSGLNEADFSVQTISVGTATISLSVPDPYVAPPDVPVNIQGGRLQIGPLTLGKDLQDQLSINGDNLFRNPVTVTVSSADPARVLVSASPNTPGQASVNVVSQPSQQLLVYVQALAGSGTVKLTASSPGYQTVESQVQLTSSSVILFGQPLAPLTPVSPAVAFQARLTPYLQNGSTAVQALRPGATPFSVQVGLTDPKVGSVTPAQLLFNPGDSQHPFSFQPLAAGSTLLSLSVPGGFTDPLALRQQLLTVIGPRVTLGGALSVGKDLQSTAIVNIPSPAAAALSVTITSDDPSRLLLSDSVHPNGAASLNITILPGATTGSGFSLIGLASSGTVSLSLTAPPLTSSSYDISLQPSGFVFGSTIGSPAANTAFSVPIVVSALNPVSLTPTGTYSLRPGLQPVAVTVASSDSSIIDPGNATTFFSENTSQGSLRVQAKSPGNATLTIQAPPGFAMPSGGATANITVR